MSIILKYRNRVVEEHDVEFIRELIAAHPGVSRWSLSKRLCEAWNWRQENGQLRDMVCRGLMLALHRGGYIELPEVRMQIKNPMVFRRKPQKVEIDSSEIAMPFSALPALDIRLVRQTKDEELFNSLLETHHYLGYSRPVGEHLKYMVFMDGRPLACLTWCSPVRHLRSRDEYIGWNQEHRTKNLRLIAYNTRYLIMPWVRIPHLASHLLGVMARRISKDWDNLYKHPVVFLETFIDPELYKGTCYRAANWVSMGMTTGRGKNDSTMKANRSLKEVLGYPLRKDFRKILLGK
jgi:Domain of unknown function (DUF4338)